MTIGLIFSGLASKFLFVYGLVTLLFSCETDFMKSFNNSSDNSGVKKWITNAVN